MPARVYKYKDGKIKFWWAIQDSNRIGYAYRKQSIRYFKDVDKLINFVTNIIKKSPTLGNRTMDSRFKFTLEMVDIIEGEK